MARILIATNSAIVTEDLVDMLRGEGHTLSKAFKHDVAIQQATQLEFDLAIVDEDLKKTGAILCSKPYGLPVTYLTSMDKPIEGEFNHVVKPVDYDEFLHEVRFALGAQIE